MKIHWKSVLSGFQNNVTALHVASKWGNVVVVEHLLASGAELECITRDGLTPLHCASRSGHAQVVQLLLNAGANYSAKTRVSLRGRRCLVLALFGCYCPPFSPWFQSGLTALHMAAQGDHPECVKLLLLQGANVDDVTIDNLTALHVSAHCGSVRVAKILLDAHSNLNARARVRYLSAFLSLPYHLFKRSGNSRFTEWLCTTSHRL